MLERKYLESVRASIREIKWALSMKSPNISELEGKTAWCADYISELMDTLDSDLLLRIWVAPGCHAEVRYERKPETEREIDLLIRMLELTKGAIQRRAPETDAASIDQSPLEANAAGQNRELEGDREIA